MSLRGSQKLAVLLCRFPETPEAELHDRGYYEDLFAHRGTGGLNDYWRHASLGSIDLDGTHVVGWTTVDRSRDDFVASRATRSEKIDGAVEASGVRREDYAGVVAIFSTEVGDSGAAGGVLAGPGDVNVTFLAHETGHLFGLGHSFDQSDRKNADWSAPGEYFDGYDIMSAMNVSSFAGDRFGRSGPLLCTGNQDRLGWLPAHRTWRPPDDRSSVTEVDLVSLGRPEVDGFLAARAGDCFVEFRTDDGWDAGLARPCVLIHRMSGPNAVVMAQDPDRHVNEWQPGQTFGPGDVEMTVRGGVRVSVLGFDTVAHKARIRVHRQIARPFVEGPALGLGGVDVGGGGIIVVGGKVVKVPPRSPVLGMLSRLAVLSDAEELLEGPAKDSVFQTVFTDIEHMAREARG